MARYYFHLQDRSGRTEDEVGRELPNLEEARKRAIKAARSIMQADVEMGYVDLTAEILVAFNDGEAILTLPFRDAVELINSPDPTLS